MDINYDKESVNVVVKRLPPMDQRSFDQLHEATRPPKTTLTTKTTETFKSVFRKGRCSSVLRNRFPIYDWLTKYKVKEDLLSDLICGITIAIFQVPQGMGYAMLSKVPPVYGLYSSFFPVLIYALMGTSRQASVGTFSLTSLMTGAIVLKWADFGHDVPGNLNGTDNSVPGNYNSSLYIPPEVDSGSHGNAEKLNLSPIEVASLVALLCGMYQAIFGLFRLGYLAVYFSEHLVSGFTTGAAIHVATSQLQNLFGIPNFPAHHGAMNQVYTYIDFFKLITNVHLITLAISGTCIFILAIFKFYINPWISKYSRVPCPIELVLVIAGTLVSNFLFLHPEHGVETVGHIQTGFPKPSLPVFSAFTSLAMESLAVAVVGFSSTVSLGKIFAQRYGYEINANQELFALGSCNLFGSFFSCIPAAASISRSSVQDGAGGKTQLVSLINCAGLLVVLLSLGSLLEPLPNCVLASIIVVSLKGMIFQVKDFWRYWKVSKTDGLIWMVTFLSVLLIDVDIGLLVGVLFSLVTLVFRSQRPKVFLLGRVADTDVYVPAKRYAKAREHSGIKIFRFGGPLHFGNVEYFSNSLEKVTGISTSLGGKRPKTSQTSLTSISTVDDYLNESKLTINDQIDQSVVEKPSPSVGVAEKDSVQTPTSSSTTSGRSSLSSSEEDLGGQDDVTRYVILDCSSFGFVDNSGVTILKQVYQMLKKNEVQCALAACPPSVFMTLEKGGFFLEVPYETVYPTIQDAVMGLRSPKMTLTQSIAHNTRF